MGLDPDKIDLLGDAGYIGYQMSVKNKLLAEQIKQSKS